MFDGRYREPIEKIVKPIGMLLRKTGMSADQLTILGLVIAAFAAVAVASGHLLLGFFLVILAALPDVLDGALAKASNSVSQRGAFFDSVIDRVTDSLLLGGLAWYVGGKYGTHAAVLPFAVMAVSSLISYERAKAESLGLSAKGGLMERAERIVVLCFGLLFNVILMPVLWVMLVLTSMTALQRFIKVWKQAGVSPRTQDRRDERRSKQSERHNGEDGHHRTTSN
ncbi:MAG: CDP-alcohol phosphatidyltransferase family protein [Ilumatobacteraceae bacterium]|nr:CDP-alcohol phosphatidyltransferase family protein [Ilumatobacteraceae bacterium]